MRSQPAYASHLVVSRAGLAAVALGLALFVGIGAVAPSVARSAHPEVVGGAPDGTAHPYVAMVLPPGASSPSCSGVLVRADTGSSLVLTAAHCFYPGPHSGRGVRVTFASTFSRTATMLSGTYTIDPLYNATTHLHDVAVIRLPSVAGITPAGLAPLEAISKLAGNSSLVTVGTGYPHPGQRRSASERVTRLSTAWVYLVAGSGNSCAGDSGGPDLLRATSTVVALTDEGSCSYDQDTRLESPTRVRSFIDRAAGLTGPRPALRYGSKGTDVKVVRSLLGVTPGRTFGPRTVAAVKSWQRGHHLSASGVVESRTWHSLGF